jgi:3-oxoacyl-[acyl-carrier protein] reductase
MDLGIKGKRALVAGGSSGIGRASAELLLREGVDVCLVARTEEKLRAVAKELGANAAARVTYAAADLAAAEGAAKAFAAAEAQLGGVDILVNNAGGPKPGGLAQLSDEDWQNAFELNLLNTVRLTKAAVSGMSARRWGRIINIQSTSVKQPIDNLMLSNSIRMAVVGFAKTLGNELAGLGITINTVAPGYASTDRLEQLAKNTADRESLSVEEVKRRWAGDVPLRRLGTPEEIAAAVVFLASEPAAYINGVVLAVDGGRVRASL